MALVASDLVQAQEEEYEEEEEEKGKEEEGKQEEEVEEEEKEEEEEEEEGDGDEARGIADGRKVVKVANFAPLLLILVLDRWRTTVLPFPYCCINENFLPNIIIMTAFFPFAANEGLNFYEADERAQVSFTARGRAAVWWSSQIYFFPAI